MCGTMRSLRSTPRSETVADSLSRMNSAIVNHLGRLLRTPTKANPLDTSGHHSGDLKGRWLAEMLLDRAALHGVHDGSPILLWKAAGKLQLKVDIADQTAGLIEVGAHD